MRIKEEQKACEAPTSQKDKAKKGTSQKRVGPDSGHYLRSNHRVSQEEREKTERRINRLMKRLTRLDPIKDAERIRVIKEDVTLLASKLFDVKGLGATGGVPGTTVGGVDATYNDTLIYAMRTYDYSRSDSFVKYFCYLYDFRKSDPVSKQEEHESDMASMDAMSDSSGSRDSYERTVNVSIFDEQNQVGDAYDAYDSQAKLLAIDETDRESLAKEEDALTEAIFVQILTLVESFQNHREDNVFFTSKRKLYRRMFFTEGLTRAIKQLVSEEEYAPFERHERDAFATADLAFQDMYTVKRCEKIAELWACDLIDEVNPVLRPGDPGYDKHPQWKLPSNLFRTHIRNELGEEVSVAAISNQRKKYIEMRDELIPQSEKQKGRLDS